MLEHKQRLGIVPTSAYERDPGAASAVEAEETSFNNERDAAQLLSRTSKYCVDLEDTTYVAADFRTNAIVMIGSTSADVAAATQQARDVGP